LAISAGVPAPAISAIKITKLNIADFPLFIAVLLLI